jgi:hypothetical protein
MLFNFTRSFDRLLLSATTSVIILVARRSDSALAFFFQASIFAGTDSLMFNFINALMLSILGFLYDPVFEGVLCPQNNFKDFRLAVLWLPSVLLFQRLRGPCKDIVANIRSAATVIARSALPAAQWNKV